MLAHAFVYFCMLLGIDILVRFLLKFKYFSFYCLPSHSTRSLSLCIYLSLAFKCARQYFKSRPAHRQNVCCHFELLPLAAHLTAQCVAQQRDLNLAKKALCVCTVLWKTVYNSYYKAALLPQNVAHRFRFGRPATPLLIM